MNHTDFMRTVAEVGYLQEELKKRAMVYQVMAKEDFATLVGLPIDSLYYISYEDYRSISSLVEMMRDKAYKYYLLNKEEVEEHFIRTNEALIMGNIWKLYLSKNPVDLNVIKNTCTLAIDNIKPVC